VNFVTKRILRMVKIAQTQSSRSGNLPAGWEAGRTAMEYASVCPICSQTLQLHTSEPHPTREAVDILTYRCEQCGSVKSNLVVHRMPREGATIFPDILEP
jgi:transposase-like protein